MQQPIRIFCSYARDSREDEKDLEKLSRHLANLKHQGLVEIWHANKISPGADTRQEILIHIKKADIILLLVSKDYLQSEDCYNVESVQAAQMEIMGIASVRVILLRPVDWKGAHFSHCQALPKNKRFVSAYSPKDDAFLEIVEDIRKIVQELRQNRYEREARRTQFVETINETHANNFMPPIDVLKVNQIEDVRLGRRTEDIRLSRQTEEPKRVRRTEEPEQRRGSTRATSTDGWGKRKQSARTGSGKQVLDDEIAPSEFTPVLRRSFPGNRRGSTRSVAPRSRSAGITSWNRVRREHNHLIKGWPGVFFFSSLAFDVVGLPAATWFWLNSGILFWLALFISLAIFAVRSITPYRLLVIPFAGFYGLSWGFIIRHYVPSWNLAVIIAIGSFIGLAHFLVFRKI
jgi:TIR domain